MKKPFVLIAAIVAVVGLGAAVAVAKERSEVETSVTLKFDARGPETDSFSGRVKAKKGCEKERKVVLYVRFLRTSYGGWLGSDRSNSRGRHVHYLIGSDRSNARGGYEIFDAARLGETAYFTKAREKKLSKNNGDKIVCKPGGSERVINPH